MKKPFIHYYIIGAALLLLAACASSGERQRMTAVLDEADRQNQAHDSVANVDSIALAAAFFDRHGTPNERMKAHYLLGCAYRDMGEAPKSLECYYDAANALDTLAADCDFSKLASVYGEMAELFHRQNLPLNELEARRQCVRAATKANVPKRILLSREMMIKPLFQLGEYDSILVLSNQLYHEYTAIGDSLLAAGSLGTAIYILVVRGEYEEAKTLMDKAEKPGGLFDDSGHIAKGREHYYYSKGLYELGIGHLDMAEDCFRRLHKYPLETYKGLMMLYRAKHTQDSIAHYSLLYEDALDTLHNQMQMESVQEMAALYNYHRYQQQAEAEARKTEVAKWQRNATLAILAMVIMMGMVVYRSHKANWERKKQTYESLLMEYKKAQDELLKLREDDKVALLDKKNEEVALLKDQIEKFEESYKTATPELCEKALAKVMHTFHESAGRKKGATIPRDYDFERMEALYFRRYPSVRSFLMEKKGLSPQETHAFVLQMQGFRNNEVQSLLSIRPQMHNTLKIRINGKLFDVSNASSLESHLNALKMELDIF